MSVLANEQENIPLKVFAEALLTNTNFPRGQFVMDSDGKGTIRFSRSKKIFISTQDLKTNEI